MRRRLSRASTAPGDTMGVPVLIPLCGMPSVCGDGGGAGGARASLCRFGPLGGGIVVVVAAVVAPTVGRQFGATNGTKVILGRVQPVPKALQVKDMTTRQFF